MASTTSISANDRTDATSVVVTGGRAAMDGAPRIDAAMTIDSRIAVRMFGDDIELDDGSNMKEIGPKIMLGSVKQQKPGKIPLMDWPDYSRAKYRRRTEHK